MDKQYLVVCAPAADRLAEKAVFAILSACRWDDADRFQVVVYSDEEHWLRRHLPSGLPILYQQLPSRAFQGLFGLKTDVLKDAAGKFEGKLLLLGPVCWLQAPPAQLFEEITSNQVLLHRADCAVETADAPWGRELRKVLRRHTFNIGGGELEIPLNAALYGTEAIGLHSGNRHWLEGVKKLADAVYSLWPNLVAERLAFSYIFSVQADIATVGDAVQRQNLDEGKLRQLMQQTQRLQNTRPKQLWEEDLEPLVYAQS